MSFLSFLFQYLNIPVCFNGTVDRILPDIKVFQIFRLIERGQFGHIIIVNPQMSQLF